MSEIYCNYNGDVYHAKIEDNKIELTSDVYVDGFAPYVDVLGNKYLNMFRKEVNKKEIDFLFEQKIFAKFKGIYFEPFAGKVIATVLNENRILLFTSSEDIAQQFGFTKKEQFVFAKNVQLDEIDEIKVVKKPIAIFKNIPIIEEIINKNDIQKWLTVHII